MSGRDIVAWMGALKPEARLVDVVLPGAHNAATAPAGRMARCQSDGVGDQLYAGIRHLCVRLNTDRKGRIWAVHGVSKCLPFVDVLQQIAEFVNDPRAREEFFILDVQEYYPQKFGPVTLTYRADPARVDALLAETICPERNAFTQFTDVGQVRMGDIRASGARYMLYNHRGDYRFSVHPPCIRPWEKQLYGRNNPAFLRALPQFLLQNSTDGLYWFQIQQTPGLGVEIGLKSPRRLDREGQPYFAELFAALARSPYLERLNIVEGDFMSEGKIGPILALNLPKGTIKEEAAADFAARFL